MTFNELTKWYLKLEKVKALASFWLVELALNKFSAVFGDVVVGDIKLADLQNYQAQRLAAGKAPATVDHEIRKTKTMIIAAFDNDMVSGTVLKVFKKCRPTLKKGSDVRDRILTRDEYESIMDNLPRHAKSVFAMGYWAGMRRGEIVGLTWDKVDMKGRVIKLEAADTKDNEPRIIPICKPLYEILKDVPRAIHDEHVFLYRGKPMNDIRRALTKACKCDVEENLSPNEKGSVTVRGRCLKEQYDKEGIIKRAIEEAGIDYKNWKIKDIQTRKWHTSMKLKTRTGPKPHDYVEKPHQIVNWAVGIKLAPNEGKHYLTALEEIIETVKPVSPLPRPRTPNKSMLCGVIEPADAHIGKYAWNQETLGGDMDVPISVKHFESATTACLDKMVGHGISKIFLVLGHDMTHIDNQAGETPRGKHSLDFDTRLPHIIAETEKVLIKLCDRCIQVAPVDILWVPGNHDYHSSYMLCRLLAQRYRNNKHVHVDTSASSRKMIVWGDNLIGLVHDAEGRKRIPTVNLLAQYAPWKDHWSQARWTELHTGHLHKREVMTVGGTIWRRIPALSTIDAWHTEGVYTDAVPACDSFIYHKKDGIFAEYPTNVDYFKK